MLNAERRTAAYVSLELYLNVIQQYKKCFCKNIPPILIRNLWLNRLQYNLKLEYQYGLF